MNPQYKAAQKVLFRAKTKSKKSLFEFSADDLDAAIRDEIEFGNNVGVDFMAIRNDLLAAQELIKEDIGGEL